MDKARLTRALKRLKEYYLQQQQIRCRRATVDDHAAVSAHYLGRAAAMDDILCVLQIMERKEIERAVEAFTRVDQDI